MAAPGLTIPTSFTATGNYVAQVNRMANATDRFTGSLGRMVGISNTTRKLLDFAKSAVLVGGAFAAANFSVKSIMDYESAIANLAAITGVSGNELSVFKTKVMEVAKATGASSIEVAKAFTAVGNNTPELLKDAAGLAEVSKQAIVLAQASKMELGPSADYLTSIMNQFNTPAMQAGKTIGMLALGANLGSIDINNVSDAMQKFGGVASQVAGVSMQESISAIEAISGKMKDAEKIGTQFKQVFLRMSSLSVQDPKALKDMMKVGLNMKLVESKSVPLIDKLKELKKLMGVKGGLEHVFGTENIQALIPLLTETDKFSNIMSHMNNEMEVGSAATIMAAKNNNTLAMGIERLKNKFANLLTGSSEVGGALDKVKEGLFWVTENMEGVIKVTGYVAAGFVALKTVTLLLRAATIAGTVALGIQNAALGISAVMMGRSNVAFAGNTVALIAHRAATIAATASQWLWNVAMGANPIGALILGVAALAAGIVYLNHLMKETIELQNQAFQKGANKASANVKSRMGMGETKAQAITNEKESVQRQQKENQFQLDREMKMGGIFADKEKLSKLAQEQGMLKQELTNLNAMEQGKLSVAGKNITRNQQYEPISGQPIANESEKKFTEVFKPQNDFSLQRESAMKFSGQVEGENKSEMTVTIKNDGASQVDVKSGKTAPKSVMPNTKSSFQH